MERIIASPDSLARLAQKSMSSPRSAPSAIEPMVLQSRPWTARYPDESQLWPGESKSVSPAVTTPNITSTYMLLSHQSEQATRHGTFGVVLVEDHERGGRSGLHRDDAKEEGQLPVHPADHQHQADEHEGERCLPERHTDNPGADLAKMGRLENRTDIEEDEPERDIAQKAKCRDVLVRDQVECRRADEHAHQ